MTTLDPHAMPPGASRRGEGLGRTVWVIAEGYIPSTSTGPEPAMLSHETACLLNTGDVDAHVTITVYFADAEPIGGYRVTVPARRTVHQRFNDLTDPRPIPRDTDYASVIVSDVPVVVQHTRLDSRQAANALLSTVAFPATPDLVAPAAAAPATSVASGASGTSGTSVSSGTSGTSGTSGSSGSPGTSGTGASGGA